MINVEEITVEDVRNLILNRPGYDLPQLPMDLDIKGCIVWAFNLPNWYLIKGSTIEHCKLDQKYLSDLCAIRDYYGVG